MTQLEKTYRFFQIFYFFTFFSNGALFPLLAVFLEEEKGLNGTQIGLIVSAIPLVTVFMQPVWGALSDYTKNPRKLLLISGLTAGLLGFVYPLLTGYYPLVLGIVVVAVFQCALIPLSDSLTLNFVQTHNKDYGNIRLLGSVGFAVAAFVLGRLTDLSGSITWIFYAFSLAILLSLFTLFHFPKRGQGVTVSFRTGLTSLFKQKEFSLFLLANFLVFGPVLANNFYFGTFLLTAGGTLAGVGVAFLLAAGSEAPFMKFTQTIINRVGLLNVLVISGLVSSGRWLLYFFEPSTTVVYATTIVQGISVGMYVPAALLFIRDIAPKTLQATAVGVYSAVGNGVGNAFFTFLGGIMIDVGTIFVMYGFFALITLSGIGLLVYVQRLVRSENLLTVGG
ncbi:MFS transporter [Sediminibacillus albus]|uniref:MFS transporter, PPP family, 3-phenylpropionic acid transporter n=1 Tax=Sediminibacillus albus TaxID=407036 RepID=A0A1G9BYS8_9BACI|nr:MFS transporter [Sediminibacillus albus]SDK44636.1 MFS transporter, PPP family, 3-phenylpropionic acid transporter [Sediminibacillus albus]